MGQAALTGGKSDHNDDQTLRSSSRSIDARHDYREFVDLKLMNLNLAFVTPDQHAGEWFNTVDRNHDDAKFNARKEQGIPKWIPVDIQEELQQQQTQRNLVNQKMLENAPSIKMPMSDRPNETYVANKNDKPFTQLLMPNLFDADSFSRFVTNFEKPISTEDQPISEDQQDETVINFPSPVTPKREFTSTDPSDEPYLIQNSVDPNASELDCRTVYYDDVPSDNCLDRSTVPECPSYTSIGHDSLQELNSLITDPDEVDQRNVIRVRTTQIGGEELGVRISNMICHEDADDKKLNFSLELRKNRSDQEIELTKCLSFVQDSCTSLCRETESELMEYAGTDLQVENTRLRTELARLQKLVAEKNEQISKFQQRIDGWDASDTSEIKYLRETIEKLEDVINDSSRRVEKSEEKCKQYELIFASMETAVLKVEEKLKSIVEELRLEVIKSRDLEAKLMNAVCSWYDVTNASAAETAASPI